jgi:hypothetical protein
MVATYRICLGGRSAADRAAGAGLVRAEVEATEIDGRRRARSPDAIGRQSSCPHLALP